MNNYASILSQNIICLRKENDMTQDKLADILGVTYQAVSKWENEQSCPDISLIPKIAEVFNVSTDYLFGKEGKNESGFETNWSDDNKLRVVLFKGKKILKRQSVKENLVFSYEGDALDIISSISVTCKNVNGDIKAGMDVECGNVEGSIRAGSHIACGDVKGDVKAGSHITCLNVEGDVKAGSHITSLNIDGNATAGLKIECTDIKGDAKAGDSIKVKKNK